jgi:hypothetical protein
MRKSLWIMLAALLVAIGAPYAAADTVTLDVSGTMTGGTLGGDIVINNTTGALISEDVTLSGGSAGPFTSVTFITADGTLTDIRMDFEIQTSSAILDLEMATATPGSLVGYDGGPLDTRTAIFVFAPTCGPQGCTDALVSGALTPAVTPAPEPSSVALMLLGLGLLFVMRKRTGQGLPQAS